jgi:hypothetical protein
MDGSDIFFLHKGPIIVFVFLTKSATRVIEPKGVKVDFLSGDRTQTPESHHQ